MRWLTAGESHGQALVGILEGMPAGVAITTSDISAALRRRRTGAGRGARMALEEDRLRLLSGVRHGRTLGSPIAVEIANSEWPSWQRTMAADPLDVNSSDASSEPLTRPRPGHADLPGMVKYGFADARPILERSSARETAVRVALGTVAAAFISQALEARILSHVVAVGSVELPAAGRRPLPGDEADLDASPVRCLDPKVAAAMEAELAAVREAKDTVGGIVEVLVYGLPVGLGSHVHADRRLDSRLAGALMGIPAVKGVEVGDGFALGGA
ncbi:MAG: chorismate synthase, partial [Micrococcales bacterium]|nr:chorismate synthase [Micrococcales bacterium]